MSNAVLFFLISCRIIDWLGSVGELVGFVIFFWSECITALSFFYAFVFLPFLFDMQYEFSCQNEV